MAETAQSDRAGPAAAGAIPALIADRYRLGRRLGRGGFGAVYEAVDQRLDKKVAIKILDEQRANTERGIKQFRAEALAASRLRHPGIIAVSDYDLLPDGRPFLVMEFATGETLETVLAKRGPLPPELAARIAADIADALSEAHASGIIHRDLKPANVMFEEGAPVPVKILDFGIAKMVDAGASTQITDPAALIGTPHYMAPEQIRDHHGPIGPHTDVYALGAVLYEMLTGRPPFAHITNAAELLLAHIGDPVPPMTGNVPPAIAAVVERALEKQPARRFASARDFAEALAGERPTKPPRSARGPVFASVAALAVVAGAIGLVAMRFAGDEPEPSTATDAAALRSGAPDAAAIDGQAASVAPSAGGIDAAAPSADATANTAPSHTPRRTGKRRRTRGSRGLPDAPKETFKVPR